MASAPSPHRALPLLLAVSLAGLTSGCEGMRKLRTFFRGDQSGAKLHLEVVPAVGLTIAIDGRVVGMASPFEAGDIAPGAHKLSIAAPDHLTFTVPIEIQIGTPLKLRVALRRVPNEPPVRLKVTLPREPKPQPQDAPKPVALPAGVTPVTITIAGDPSTAAILDGEVKEARILKIDHVTGDLGMGRLRVSYRVGAGGMLELRIPDDGTQWFRDGEPVDPDARLSFYRGKTRLQQIQPNGETQTIFLAR